MPKQRIDTFIPIDGISVNATHFGAMKEPEAIKKMIADGFVPGVDKKDQEAWAKSAYKLINQKESPVE